VKKSIFLTRLLENNMSFPEEFFLKFLEIITVEKDEESGENLLSYNRLRAVIDIYNTCPVRFKEDILNSDNIKNSME
jgi:hypothetical protein